MLNVLQPIFVGDQFDASQPSALRRSFSIFYFFYNFGLFCGEISAPVLRQYVSYEAAFVFCCCCKKYFFFISTFNIIEKINIKCKQKQLNLWRWWRLSLVENIIVYCTKTLLFPRPINQLTILHVTRHHRSNIKYNSTVVAQHSAGLLSLLWLVYDE